MIRTLLPHLKWVLVALGLCACQVTSNSPLRASLTQLDGGFHWEVFDDINVAVPCPDGWYRAVSSARNAYTGSVSLEDYNTVGAFRTGFTVQVVTEVESQAGRPASALGLTMGNDILTSNAVQIIDGGNLDLVADYSYYFMRYRDSRVAHHPIIVHKVFMALDPLDSLYIFTFESPADLWIPMFRNFGAPILEKLVRPGVVSTDLNVSPQAHDSVEPGLPQ